MKTVKNTRSHSDSRCVASERDMLLLSNDIETRLMAIRVLRGLYPVLDLRSIADFVDGVCAANGAHSYCAESERAKPLSTDIKARVMAIRILAALYPAVRLQAIERF